MKKCESKKKLGVFCLFHVFTIVNKKEVEIMISALKQIVNRDDGFLEVTLKKTKDFDDYLFQQIHKDERCLMCVRDPRSKTKLFYDTKGYLTLKAYLQAHVFEEGELLSFLIYVLEDMVKVNAGKPISMNLDHIYLSYDGGVLRFLVFPIVLENWLFQKEELQNFLKSFIKEVRVADDYAALGYVSYCLKNEEMTLPLILQGLHDLEKRSRKEPSLLERLFHTAKKVEYHVRDLPLSKSNPFAELHIAEDSEQYHCQIADTQTECPTQELLKKQNPGLVDLKTWETIEISQDIFKIGRGKDNDLVIAGKVVSLRHAQIEKDILRDCKSANGTFVNGERIEEIQLHDQDIIRFANAQYRYQKGSI